MTGIPGPVGFVGLGLMGLPMARNLAAAGAELTVFNRTAAKARPLVDGGARLAGSVEELAGAVRGGVVVICVSDTPAMEATVAALTGCDLTGMLVIDMGTTTVAATRAAARAIADKGGCFIDAPVSGGAVGAQEGTLSIMAGGSADDVARAMPLFQAMGKATTHIGPVGGGHRPY